MVSKVEYMNSYGEFKEKKKKRNVKIFNQNQFLSHAFCLMLLSHFSRVLLCATPEMAAHQAPPSLGFSRQEHWSGLPSEKPGKLEVGGASRDSTGLGALEEGLISS